MKRQASFRVRKRDGRVEWMRASKLSRSIALALTAAESLVDERAPQVAFSVDDPGGGLVTECQEDWRAIDMATAVITGLCGELDDSSDEIAKWTAERIAQAVQQVLSATGYEAAATAYARARDIQSRRRGVLHAAMPSADADHTQGIEGKGAFAQRVSDCPPDPRTV